MARHWIRTLARAALLALLTAAPAWAQRTSPAAPAAGPTLEGAISAVRAPVTTTHREPLGAALARPLRQSETLMIIGGGLFLTGAIIGDDAGTILMVGGVVTGLYGLYQYLQERPAAASSAR